MSPMQPMAPMVHSLPPTGHPAYRQPPPAQVNPYYDAWGYEQPPAPQYSATPGSQAAAGPAGNQAAQGSVFAQQWAQPAAPQADPHHGAADRSRTLSSELAQQQPADGSQAGVPQPQPRSVFAQQWAQSPSAQQADQAVPAARQRTASAELPPQQPVASQAGIPASSQQPQASVFASQWVQQKDVPEGISTAQQQGEQPVGRQDQEAQAKHWQPPVAAAGAAGLAAGAAAGIAAGAAVAASAGSGGGAGAGIAQPSAQAYGGSWQPPSLAPQHASAAGPAAAAPQPQAVPAASPGASPQVSPRQV
jgi:hypothetical protein